MAISEAYANSQTVSTTEWSLTADSSTLGAVTDDGIYQVFIDTNAVTAADVFTFTLYEKTLSSSTQRKVLTSIFSGVMTEPVWASPALVLMHGWEMSLKKNSGTDRNFDWSIRKIA